MAVHCIPSVFRWAANLGGGGHCGQRQNTSCKLTTKPVMYFYVHGFALTNTHILKQKAKHKTHDRTLQTTSTCCPVYHIQVVLFFMLILIWNRPAGDLRHPTSLCFNMTPCVKPDLFFLVVLESSSRTCYLLRSLRIETGLFPTQPKSTSTSSTERRNTVSLSTSSILLW